MPVLKSAVSGDSRELPASAEFESNFGIKRHGFRKWYDDDFLQIGAVCDFQDFPQEDINDNKNFGICCIDSVLYQLSIGSGFNKVANSTDFVQAINGIYCFRHCQQNCCPYNASE